MSHVDGNDHMTSEYLAANEWRDIYVWPICRLLPQKSWLIWKDLDAGQDWGQEEKGTTEDEMIGWHHQLDGHGFGWTPGVGDGQGGLACWSPWGRKESDTTEQLNWAEPQKKLVALAVGIIFYVKCTRYSWGFIIIITFWSLLTRVAII